MRAFVIARRLEVGQVYVNGALFTPLAPIGGLKQSVPGREMGKAGLEELIELKAILI